MADNTIDQTGMKHIPLWKIVLISIVTLGIYQLVWIVKRRNELVAKYNQPIPDWKWLVLPGVTLLSVVLLGLIVGALTGQIELAFNITAIGTATLQTVAFAIVVIWLWQFAKATAYVTNNHMSARWSLVLLLMSGGFFNLFAQYYFNRADPPKSLPSKVKAKPSRAFMATAVLTIAVPVILPALFVLFVLPYFSRITDTSNQLTSLQKQHEVCSARLQSKYTQPIADTNTNEQFKYWIEYYLCDDVAVEAHKTQMLFTKQLSGSSYTLTSITDPDGYDLRLRINQVFLQVDPMGIAAQEDTYAIGEYEGLARDIMWAYYEATGKDDFTKRALEAFKLWFVVDGVNPQQEKLATRAIEEIYNDPTYKEVTNESIPASSEQYDTHESVPGVEQMRPYPELSGELQIQQASE